MQDLTVNSSGATAFKAAVGSVTPLKSLTTDAVGTGSFLSVTTTQVGGGTGNQALQDATVSLNGTYTTNSGTPNANGGTFTANSNPATGHTILGGNVAIVTGPTDPPGLPAPGASDVTFHGTISGPHDLNIKSGGTVNFENNVGLTATDPTSPTALTVAMRQPLVIEHILAAAGPISLTVREGLAANSTVDNLIVTEDASILAKTTINLQAGDFVVVSQGSTLSAGAAGNSINLTSDLASEKNDSEIGAVFLAATIKPSDTPGVITVTGGPKLFDGFTLVVPQIGADANIHVSHVGGFDLFDTENSTDTARLYPLVRVINTEFVTTVIGDLFSETTVDKYIVQIPEAAAGALPVLFLAGDGSQKNAVQIVGSTQGDRVQIGDFNETNKSFNYFMSNIAYVQVYGLDGNDSLETHTTASTILDGGAGNDTIKADTGSGQSFLFGGAAIPGSIIGDTLIGKSVYDYIFAHYDFVPGGPQFPNPPGKIKHVDPPPTQPPAKIIGGAVIVVDSGDMVSSGGQNSNPQILATGGGVQFDIVTYLYDNNIRRVTAQDLDTNLFPAVLMNAIFKQYAKIG